ncbi:hypothetical protein TCAL_08255 [Tigriopus californicus]|uniref:Transcription factor CBF/NF-Y/archaeal histone domain-containing protein n=1 Tax=Tigriopus californicus TaxID=6832 RepID=A0A553NY12_TIGCA|nr:DNA polymerase epsilon subunit 4-like [Tigriopus californicus]TRY70316.1 hypothetical protein TCAL_08255 [Tigriopus californicus]
MDESNGTGNDGLRLPWAKVRSIAKLDETQLTISQDAVFVLARSTELFIEFLAKVSAEKMAQTKRRSLGKVDIDEAIAEHDNLMFLEDLIDMDNPEILSVPKP